MGFTFRMKIERDKAPLVKAAIQDLYDWVDKHGGYDGMYLPWRLVNHMSVVLPENDFDSKEVREYVCGGERLSEGEALVFHHDIPWLWRLSPEVMAKARECFEKHGVIDIWWNIIKENCEGTDLIDQLLPDLEKNKHEARG